MGDHKPTRANPSAAVVAEKRTAARQRENHFTAAARFNGMGLMRLSAIKGIF
jgi:hypothetical protein